MRAEAADSNTIASLVKNCLESFEIDPSRLMIVASDNAKAMKTAVSDEMSKWAPGVAHCPCLAHTLDLAISSAVLDSKVRAWIVCDVAPRARDSHTRRQCSHC